MTNEYGIDLGFIPDLVRDDAELLKEPDSKARDEAQYALVERACRRLRQAQPELATLDDDALYDLVAQAFAERNG